MSDFELHGEFDDFDQIAFKPKPLNLFGGDLDSYEMIDQSEEVIETYDEAAETMAHTALVDFFADALATPTDEELKEVMSPENRIEGTESIIKLSMDRDAIVEAMTAKLMEGFIGQGAVDEKDSEEYSDGEELLLAEVLATEVDALDVAEFIIEAAYDASRGYGKHPKPLDQSIIDIAGDGTAQLYRD